MTDLHYQMQGTGTPLTLIHSPGVDLREWRLVTPFLTETHTVLAFDGRGAGQSPVPVAPTNYIEDLRTLLDDLHIPVTTLIGHSLGGQIATDFALTYPHRVSCLILIGPALSGYQFSPAYQRLYARVQAVAPDVEKMTQASLDFPGYQVVMASPQRNFIMAMTRDNFEKMLTWKNAEQIWPQPPAITRLHTLSIPTLFIIGTHDSEDLFHIEKEFGRVPDIRFARIEGADHMPPLTHPQAVAALIAQFVGK